MHSGDKHAWWPVVLMRGVVRLKAMPADQAHTGVWMAELVDGPNVVLGKMLGPDSPKPRICFRDRGPWLYNSLTGETVEVYRATLCRNGCRAFAGADGTQQPADIADIFLHDTVVAWVRTWRTEHRFKAVGHVEEKLRIFIERLHACKGRINRSYDVVGLCHDTVKDSHTAGCRWSPHAAVMPVGVGPKPPA